MVVMRKRLCILVLEAGVPKAHKGFPGAGSSGRLCLGAHEG